MVAAVTVASFRFLHAAGGSGQCVVFSLVVRPVYNEPQPLPYTNELHLKGKHRARR